MAASLSPHRPSLAALISFSTSSAVTYSRVRKDALVGRPCGAQLSDLRCLARPRPVSNSLANPWLRSLGLAAIWFFSGKCQRPPTRRRLLGQGEPPYRCRSRPRERGPAGARDVDCREGHGGTCARPSIKGLRDFFAKTFRPPPLHQAGRLSGPITGASGCTRRGAWRPRRGPPWADSGHSLLRPESAVARKERTFLDGASQDSLQPQYQCRTRCWTVCRN